MPNRKMVRMVRADSGGMVILLVLATLGTALAQLPTATILGVVKDSTGAVVPNAPLTARNVETGQSRTAVSGGDGSYRFAALPVGAYEVRAEHAGFQAEVRSSLTLTVGQEAVVNFSLQIGAVEQTVAVTAEAPLVNTTSGSLGGLVNEEKVADLPLNGRNFVNLTLLQPGIAQNSSSTVPGVVFSSNGAPYLSNNYLLDGAIMQNNRASTFASTSGTTLGIEGIREWRVITNSFSAEYGMTMGSQTVIVSKSGTNNFHGSAFEFLRNDKLDARNFFDRQTPTFSKRLPAFKRNNFGGSGGGPIRKDQMFFFGTYEGLRERVGLTIASNDIPASAKLDGGLVPKIDPRIKPLLTLFPDPNLPDNQLTFPFSQPNTEDYGQGRWDWTLSSSDSFFARFTRDNDEQTTTDAFPRFTRSRTSQNQYLTVSETHILSPTLLNTFRFSYSRTQTAILSSDPPEFRGPQFAFVPNGTSRVGSIAIGGVTTNGTGTSPALDERQNIFAWSDDLFYTKGDHSLKFGALINRYQQFSVNTIFSLGQITFPDIESFLLAQPSAIVAETPGSLLDRTIHYTTLGFYLQDDWRVKPNFTLNLGVRYEFFTNPEEATGRGLGLRDIRHDAQLTPGPIINNPSLSNVSPRFGFAWDVRGDGKTAVRGGFALLYDLATLGSSFLNIIPASPPISSRSSVSGALARQSFNNGFPLVFPPEALGKSARVLDFHIEQPYLMQYNVTVERRLPFNMAVTLAYAGSRGVDLLGTNEGNPVTPQILPDGRKFFPVGAPRDNPNFADIELKNAAANSWYNSLQFGLLKRLSKGLQFQSSFTWSHTIDNSSQTILSGEATGTPVFPVLPSDLSVDKGNSVFDITRNWRFNAIYRLPDLNPSGGALRKVLNGWWLSGLVSVQDGLPFTPVLQANRSRSGVNGGARGIDRPDLVPGRNVDNIIRGGPDRYFDPTAFTVPEAGFLGTAGRNILRGPGLATVDFTIAKDTPVKYLGESGKLGFRAEFFNILNRPNFQTPAISGSGGSAGPNVAAFVFAGRSSGEAPLPTVARITGTTTTSRQIQFSLKLLF